MTQEKGIVLPQLGFNNSKTLGGLLPAGVFTLTGSEPAAPDPPTIPPVTTLVSPAPGSTLGADTPLVVDVTDVDGGFARILLVVTIAPAVNSGVALLVHDGVTFRPGFKDFSTRTSIANGFRYSIRKDLGWADDVRVEVYAIDDTGNEST
jgi:hypothetical protein